VDNIESFLATATKDFGNFSLAFGELVFSIDSSFTFRAPSENEEIPCPSESSLWLSPVCAEASNFGPVEADVTALYTLTSSSERFGDFDGLLLLELFAE
jgi:hypothetical protein